MKNVIKLFSILFLVSGVIFTSCEPKKKDPVKVTGVVLLEKTLKMEVGDDATLKATVIPDDAEDKTVTWESNNDEVAEVDANGKVKAVGVGKAKITVRTKDGNFADVCNVEVELKMAENFEITAMAGLYYNGTIYSIFPQPLPLTAFEDGYTYYWTGIAFYGFFRNTSKEIIPKGTPYKFSLKRNGTLVEFEGTDGVPVTLVISELDRDIKPDSLGWLCTMNPFRVSNKTEQLGANKVTLEIFQMGKKDYSSPKVGELNYTLELKDDGAPPPFAPKNDKNERVSVMRQSPYIDIKSNVVVK